MQGSHDRAYRSTAPLTSRQPGLPFVGPHISQQLRLVLVAAAVAAVAASPIIPLEEEEEVMYNLDLFKCDTIDIAGQEPGQERIVMPAEKFRWPKGQVPYVLHTSITNPVHKEVILQAIDNFHSKTCVRFVERTNEKNYIEFRHDKKGCGSPGGMRGGKQIISLGKGCMSVGTAIHEMMHALGFFHEHTRYDRDDYVIIHFENVKGNFSHLFEKSNGVYSGEEYNYNSIMHYPSYAYSKEPGLTTIEPIDPKVKLVHSHYKLELPQGDANQVNFVYCKDPARRR